MMRLRTLLLLIGPLALGAVLSTPAEACWLFGGCGGRAAYRPVYGGYGYTSYYAPYSSYGYYGGGCNSCGSCGYGGCNSCSGGNCGISYYGGGYSNCCNVCGGSCGYGNVCSNCTGGDCQLGASTTSATTSPPTPPQTPEPYSDTGTRSGESHPTTRNPPPDSELGPRRTIVPDDDSTTTTPLGDEASTPPSRQFRGTTPPAEGASTTPVNPPDNNQPTPPATGNEASLRELKDDTPDGAGFRDELDPDSNFRAPVIKVDLDDKVAWTPTATRARISTSAPSYKTARLVRIAAYPAPTAWVPTLAELGRR